MLKCKLIQKDENSHGFNCYSRWMLRTCKCISLSEKDRSSLLLSCFIMLVISTLWKEPRQGLFSVITPAKLAAILRALLKCQEKVLAISTPTVIQKLLKHLSDPWSAQSLNDLCEWEKWHEWGSRRWKKFWLISVWVVHWYLMCITYVVTKVLEYYQLELHHPHLLDQQGGIHVAGVIDSVLIYL